MNTAFMNELYIRNNKIFIRYNELLNQRATLIFIHGLSGSISAWEKYISIFNENYNLILIDQRGHGKSFKYNRISEYDIEYFSEDLHYLLNHFQIHEPIFIAHSFGCLVLIDYLSRYPSAKGKAIFLSARFNLKNIAIKLLSSLVLKVLNTPKHLASALNKHQHIDYTLYPSNKDFDIARTWADISNTGLYIYLSCIKHISKLDYSNILHRVAIPTLFIHGASDSIFNIKLIQKLYKKIPDARMIEVKNANHVMIFSHTTELSTQILTFIKTET